MKSCLTLRKIFQTSFLDWIGESSKLKKEAQQSFFCVESVQNNFFFQYLHKFFEKKISHKEKNLLFISFV